MAIAPEDVAAPVLTYEDYLAEGEIFKRYDIIDGVRIFMTNPTRRHQRILLRISRLFYAFELETRSGETLVAPQDVLITRSPLRTRQPDVAFISRERLERNAEETNPAPLDPSPELVVEVLSPGERLRARAARIADYCSVDVRECWVVDPRTLTVEVLRLTPDGPVSIATYGQSEALSSEVFPGLRLPVAAFFAD
jgi:Uma2 family endonuclease